MLTLCLIAALTAAAWAEQETFTDANGREVALIQPERVVALYGSYGKVWLEAGGELLAIPEDALSASIVAEKEGIRSIGSHKQPGMELLFSLNPDFVILSADIAEHAAIGETLEQAGVTCAYFSNRDWRDYMEMVGLFTEMTGDAARLDELTASVQQPIEEMLEKARKDEAYGQRTALLLRVNSTSVRSKDSESTIAGVMLRDMGFVNIADSDATLMENLTMEAILLADPDWIFAVPQGADTDAALRSLENALTGNPAWATLTAVQNGRFVMLPKELFHQHPNADWAQAYAHIQALLEQ